MPPERASEAVLLNAGVSTSDGAASRATGFAELDELLEEFVVRVEAILGDDFVGAYLTGSFALGAGDLQSDCDFLVVTEVRVSAAQEQAVRELHDELPTRHGQWMHNLEGSYAPRADLETLAALDRAVAVCRPWLAGDAVVHPLQHRRREVGAPRARNHA